MNERQFWKSIGMLLRFYPAVDTNVYESRMEQVFKVHDGISQIDMDDVRIENLLGILLVSSEYTQLGYTESHENEVLSVLNSGQIPSECEGFLMAMRLRTLDWDEEGSIGVITVVDFVNTRFAFVFEMDEYYNFKVALREGELDIAVDYKDNPEPEIDWEDIYLRPKLLKWSNMVYDEGNSNMSLELIHAASYHSLYTRLKDKYVEQISNIWAENTEPRKLIFEDIAIAAYLICLWREYGCEPFLFADISCGNGVLVYVLTQEGFEGYGYDVKRRKIWDRYPNPNLFYERNITISDFRIPVDVDWVVGNHSDELTPWIPIMAGLASPYMSYFILPCCPYELSGIKYQSTQPNTSVYDDFIRYVEHISRICEFVTIKDRLPLPIKGRTALIGFDKNSSDEMHDATSWNIQEYLKNELPDEVIKEWKRHEVVTNCSLSEDAELTEIIKRIFLYLLTPKQENDSWNCGVQRSLQNIEENMSQEDRDKVQFECGDLKTLLKLKPEVFLFSLGNLVKIRRPRPRGNAKVQQKLCFFAENHPEGCPLTHEHCTFTHN